MTDTHDTHTLPKHDLRTIVSKMTPRPWVWIWAHPGYLLMQKDPEKEHHHKKCILDGKIEEGGNDCNIIGDKTDMDGIVTLRNCAEELLGVVDKARNMHSIYELNDEWKQQLGEALAALDRKLGE